MRDGGIKRASTRGPIPKLRYCFTIGPPTTELGSPSSVAVSSGGVLRIITPDGRGMVAITNRGASVFVGYIVPVRKAKQEASNEIKRSFLSSFKE